MKVLNLKRKRLDFDQYKMRRALESDYSKLIKESCIIKEDGKIMVVYLELGDELDSRDIVAALNNIKYSTGYRTLGLKSTSRVFGHLPRLALRRDFCTVTSLAKESPNQHQIICDYAVKVSELYRQYNPELYKQHMDENGKVLEDYVIKDSAFTSGIINKNNPLKYHFDRGNFKSVWSNMLVFKHRIGGGVFVRAGV